MPLFERQTELNVPAEFAFAWHLRPKAFERLTPPWEPVSVVHRDPNVPREGDVVLRIGLFGPVAQHWRARHRDFVDGRQFVDMQVEGPFARWEHTHLIEPLGEERCRLIDRIDYELPGGTLGAVLGGGMVRAKLERMFRYRHAVTRDDLNQLYRYRKPSVMKILVSGASGLVGSHLVPFLENAGHTVLRLTRSASKAAGDVEWDIAAGRLDPQALEGVDAVIHLAGKNIADGRWSESARREIVDSRVKSTELLARTMAELDVRPKTFLCASALGYYGDRGDELLTEESPPGSGFLAETCVKWEQAAEPAKSAGVRVVHLRTAMVLSPDGGALKKMLPIFQMGGGGVVGSGKQYVSWITLDDVTGAAFHCLTNETIAGPVNFGSPNPVTNREFTKTLGKVLKRPTFVPVPAAGLRMAFGEMADEMLLASCRMQPQVLQTSGYEFRYPELEPALRHVLGR